MNQTNSGSGQVSQILFGSGSFIFKRKQEETPTEIIQRLGKEKSRNYIWEIFKNCIKFMYNDNTLSDELFERAIILQGSWEFNHKEYLNPVTQSLAA